MGLCSIAAHHLGAERVLATDGDVDVLENLRHNINLNVSDVDADGNNYSGGRNNGTSPHGAIKQ